MLESMDADELVDWVAWERVNGPLGSRREDYNAAGIIRAIAHFSGRVKSTPKLADCLVFRPPDREGSAAPSGTLSLRKPEEQIAYFRALVRMGIASETTGEAPA